MLVLLPVVYPDFVDASYLRLAPLSCIKNITHFTQAMMPLVKLSQVYVIVSVGNNVVELDYYLQLSEKDTP